MLTPTHAQDAKRLTDELVDEFGGSTSALAKLVTVHSSVHNSHASL